MQFLVSRRRCRCTDSRFRLYKCPRLPVRQLLYMQSRLPKTRSSNLPAGVQYLRDLFFHPADTQRTLPGFHYRSSYGWRSRPCEMQAENFGIAVIGCSECVPTFPPQYAPMCQRIAMISFPVSLINRCAIIHALFAMSQQTAILITVLVECSFRGTC